jgi:hypothetical protein
MTEEVYSLKNGIKMGAIAGHIAAWSIFGLILLVDGYMFLPTGTFYSVIGVAMGLSGPSAMWLGVVLHMVTGTVIGAIFGCITSGVKVLRIRSPQKALALAVITGIVTWAIVFMPITLFAVEPSLGSIVEILGQPVLVETYPLIIAGSIGMHIIYGGMLGFMYWLAVAPYPYARSTLTT